MLTEDVVSIALRQGAAKAVDALLEARWMQKAARKMEKEGTEGSFSAKAEAAGMSTKAYADMIMSAPEGKYPPELRKQANFARNAIRISRKR